MVGFYLLQAPKIKIPTINESKCVTEGLQAGTAMHLSSLTTDWQTLTREGGGGTPILGHVREVLR